MAHFMETRLAQPIPGAIGMTATLYLTSLAGDSKALSTRYEYHVQLTKLGEMFPDSMAGDFTTLDIEQFLMVTCQGLAPATRKKVIAIASGYFGYLHDRGAIPTNPTRPIRRPHLPDPEPKWWTPEEVRAILAAEMPPRDHLLLETLARTAQRSTVVRTLTWDQVRLDLKEPAIYFKPGKGGKIHVIPMDRELIHDFMVFKRLSHPRPTSFVFQSRNRHTRGSNATHKRGAISTQQVNRIVERACRQAGVRVGSAHQLRASAITNLLHQGVPLDVVSRDIANHSSVLTTMKHYRGSESQRVREALKQLPY